MDNSSGIRILKQEEDRESSYWIYSMLVDKKDDFMLTLNENQKKIEKTEKISNLLKSIYGKEDLNLYVSQNVAKAYVRALGGYSIGVGANGIGDQGQMWYNGQGLSFDGVQIFMAPGLNDNQMVLAQKSNLYFGTGLLNDMNLVKVLDMADLDGSQNVRFIMRYTASVQYGYGSEVVLYDPTV